MASDTERKRELFHYLETEMSSLQKTLRSYSASAVRLYPRVTPNNPAAYSILHARQCTSYGNCSTVSSSRNNGHFHLAFKRKKKKKHDTNLSFTRNQNVEYVSVPQPSVFQQQQQQQPQIIYVAIPQQQQLQQQPFDPKLGVPMQVAMQQVVQPSQMMYQTSTPLTLLNRYASPVDCPTCGQRTITRIMYVVGGSTQ
jgi:predicted RNA-binding Zn-ribbon protein involved in translation (DUF1610 family)